jgi:hypothetical protein
MADRTSASLFGQFFELLAKLVDEEPVEPKEVAEHLWGHIRGYDFNAYQMSCDEALLKLGLARMEGELIQYKDER